MEKFACLVPYKTPSTMFRYQTIGIMSVSRTSRSISSSSRRL
ncbi:hypothetical protein CCACVL1_17254 [Corchorus capsularis]|uniref:Uncharacterized protein n=1 Tax=Corchorus capsularis TaxID=210143 RepID=A0A1R3HSV4_COCAP|nr:hypothetical protein CCACVL1_17254 [Corchorus capsularis]